jgi:hypothetical protein
VIRTGLDVCRIIINFGAGHRRGEVAGLPIDSIPEKSQPFERIHSKVGALRKRDGQSKLGRTVDKPIQVGQWLCTIVVSAHDHEAWCCFPQVLENFLASDVNAEVRCCSLDFLRDQETLNGSRNLVTSLFEHEQIKTTLPKARDAARLAEKVTWRFFIPLICI